MLAPLHDHVAPESGPRDAAMARVLEEPGILVAAAFRAGVSVARVVAAVASVVVAAGGSTEAAEAAERVAEGVVWRGLDGKRLSICSTGALRCPPHQDDYDHVRRGIERCGSLVELATRKLCRAVYDCDVELAGGELASDGADYLADAVICAKDVIGAKAAVDAFLTVIPWDELAAAVAEVES